MFWQVDRMEVLVFYIKSLASMITILMSLVWLLLSYGLPMVLSCWLTFTCQLTSECIEEYIDLCSKITVLFNDYEAAYLMVIGDFNCAWYVISILW